MKKMRNQLLLVAFALAANTGVFAQFGTGLVADRSLDDKERLISKPLGFGANLPAKHNLLEYIPSIKSQGRTSSCGGWSSTYYVATIEYAVLKGITNQTELDMVAYDPFYTYLSAMKDNTAEQYEKCGKGTQLAELCKTLKNKGAKRRVFNEVNCGDDLSKIHSTENSLVDFKGYSKLVDWSLGWEGNAEAISQVLSDNHPVIMGMVLPPSFRDIGDDGIFRPKDSERIYPWPNNWGGHAMAIVGYDDEMNGGSFIVANSWGEDWGDNGFLYINYKDFYDFGINAYVMDTELKDVASIEDGCAYGDCENGYGVSKVKGNGTYEGYFKEGEMTEGFYFNYTKKLFKGGRFFMKKMAKKNSGYLLYDGYDTKKPIGFKI